MDSVAALEPVLDDHPLMTPLETRIGHAFADAALLAQALTHPSQAKKRNNQRLEFLGDAVLGAVIARMLFEMFPKDTEGELARRQAALVRGETIAQVAAELGLGAAIDMASSEVVAGGRDNPTNLEDACEALIGAIYLDGGMAAAERFILPRWSALAKSAVAPPKDAKTALQEWAQARGLPVPVYAVTQTEGPAHAPVFTIEARIEGQAPAAATAASKKVAEQAAAAALLKRVLHA
jgi:ribonuclease-3